METIGLRPPKCTKEGCSRKDKPMLFIWTNKTFHETTNECVNATLRVKCNGSGDHSQAYVLFNQWWTKQQMPIFSILWLICYAFPTLKDAEILEKLHMSTKTFYNYKKAWLAMFG